MSFLSGVNKKIFLFSAILLVPLAVLFARISIQESRQTEGTLYVGLEMPFYGLDVLNGAGLLVPEMAIMNNLVLERLFAYGPAEEIVPVLGLAATSSEDGLVWHIELRKDVFFHDGTPFNADAVVHHWKRILDPEKQFRGRYFFHPLDAVEKTGSHAVKFILNHPWSAFLTILSDESYSFAYIPSPAAVEKGTHNEQPMGTGPFKFHKWNKIDHFSVIRNDNYWQKGKPYLDKVVFRHIPDPQSRYASLVSYQVDAITVDRGTIINKAKQNQSLSVHPSQGSGAEIVLLNTTKPPLDDIRVRKALALANKQSLHVEIVYQNSIPVIQHPYGPWVSCPSSTYPEYDIEKARELIADYGKPVELECMHSNTLRGRNIGELLQEFYRKIGVHIKPVAMNQGRQIMKVMEKDYQMATWRILSTRDHGPVLYRNFHSQSPANFSGYNSQRMDSLLGAQRREQNLFKRDEMLCEIAALINEDVPIIYRGGRRFHIISSKKVQNIVNSGEMVDLSGSWITGLKVNPFGLANEQAAAGFECPDPGDVDAMKSTLLGSWKGDDSWGGQLKIEFRDDDTVAGNRSGGYNLKGSYTICEDRVMWRSTNGTLVSLTLSKAGLEGTFKRGAYGGTLSLTKDN